MKLLLVPLFILIYSTVNGFESKEEQRQIDSLKIELLKPNKDSNSVKILLLIAFQYISLNKIDSALDPLNKALAIAEETNYTYAIAKCNEMLGQCYYAKTKSVVTAIKYFDKAIEYYLLAKHRQEAIMAMVYLSYVYEKYEDYTKLYEIAERIITISKEINWNGGIFYGRQNMAQYYNEIGDYKKAAEYQLLSLNDCLSRMEISSVASLCNQLGITYSKHDLQKAIFYQNKAIAINKLLKDESQTGWNYLELGNIYNENGRFDHAIQAYLKAYEMLLTIKDTFSASMALGQVSSTYLKNKKYPEALKYKFESIFLDDQSNKQKNKLQLAEIYLNAAKNSTIYLKGTKKDIPSKKANLLLAYDYTKEFLNDKDNNESLEEWGAQSLEILYTRC